MATRYWVGGTGTWTSSNTTNWSATSGGTGGASVPTSADDVIINNASGAGSLITVTATSGQSVCNSITVSYSTGSSFRKIDGTLTANGNVSFGVGCDNSTVTVNLNAPTSATLALGGTGNIAGGTYNFNTSATYTLSITTSNSYNLRTYVVNAGTINGSFGAGGTNSLTMAGGTVTTSGTNFVDVAVSGGSLTMSGALTCATMTVSGGTFAKSTFTLTCSTSFTCTGTTARTISGTATIVLSGTGTVFSCADATNLTLTNAQTIQPNNSSTTTRSLNGPTTGDTASNVFSITINTGGTYGLDVSGAFLDFAMSGTGARTISNQTRKIYGSWSDQLAVVYTAGSLATTFAATTTGKTASFNTTADFPLIFNGVGGAWTLTWNNITTSVNSDVTLTNGSLTFSGTNNFFKSLSSSNSNTRTIVLPSSGASLSLSGTTPIDFTTSTGLTLTPGTGFVDCSNANPTFNGGGKTFYQVRFTSTAVGAIVITGANTYQSITVAARASAGIGTLTLYANQTTTDITLNNGSSLPNRLFVKSDTLGTARTIAASGSKTIVNCDFRDITASTAFSTATTCGNCGGNTGITFPAAKTVYWNLAAGGNWSATAWATTSGGTVSANNFPLAQDTANIVDTGLTTGNTITINAAYNLPSINTTRSSAWTLAGSTNNNTYGSLSLDSNLNFTYSGTLTFQSRSNQSISLGPSLAAIGGIIVESIGATVTLNSDITLSNPLIIRRGTFTQQGNITCGNLTVESTATAFSAITLISISCSNWTFPSTGPTLTLGLNHTIQFSSTFAGGGKSYQSVKPSTGTSSTITGSNTIVSLDRPSSGYSGTVYFEAGSTQTITTSFMSGGTTTGSRMSLRSTVSGTRFNLSKSSGTITVNSMDIQDSNATGGAVWNSPTINNNLDSGNNLGWIFGAAAGSFLMMFR